MNARLVILFVATFLSGIGTSVTQMYSLIYVYGVTESNFYAALSGVCVFGAGGLSSAIMMRVKRPPSYLLPLVFAEIVSGLAMATLASTWQSLPMLFAAIAVVYLAAGFYKPAFSSLLYELATDEASIARVNSTATFVQTSSLALGWLIAPLLYRELSYQGLYLLDAGTFFVSALLLAGLWLATRTSGRPPLARENGERVALAFTIPAPLRTAFSLFATLTVALAVINALEIGAFRTAYELSDAGIGLFFLLWMIGGGIGAALVGRWQGLASIALLASVTIAFIGLALVFCLARDRWLGGASYLVAGGLFATSEILLTTIIHRRLSRDDHLHAFGAKQLVYNAIMLGALPVVGALADQTSIALASSAVLCPLGVVALRSARKV